jgi:hypothetical protein
VNRESSQCQAKQAGLPSVFSMKLKLQRKLLTDPCSVDLLNTELWGLSP